MKARKTQYWLKIQEPPAMQLTLDLYNHKQISVEGIRGTKGWSRGRFTFKVDEPGLEDVTFQIGTARNRLGIFAPGGLDVNEVLAIFKPILDDAAGRDVRLTLYHTGPGKGIREKPLASSKAISKIIKRIDDAISLENWVECNSWIIELRQSCIQNRTGHIVELLDAIKRYVNIQKFLENEDTIKELAVMISYILQNEKDAKDEETANKTIKALFKSARKIALLDRKVARHCALRFLGETKKEESVDIIINLIKQHASDVTGNFEDEIHYLLFGSELGKTQSEYVAERLVELSSSEKEPVRSVARRLQRKPRLF